MDLNTVTEIARPRQRREFDAWRPGDAFLAGGTWLFSEPQPQLTRLIDLAALDWPALAVNEAGLEIAATCTIAKLDALALPAEWLAAPLVARCCRAFLASFKVWNTATVGGNLCMSLPAGPMISLGVALDGTCTIWTADGGERRVPVIDFVRGPQQNALAAGEVLRSIALPATALTRRSAFRQISLTPLGRSAALLIGTSSPRAGDFVLTVTASTPRPLVFRFARIPQSQELRDRLEREVGRYYDDIHGAPAWRRHVTLLLAEEIRRELAGDAAA
jgi:CO/xanthine dehydrogenase FAD-binding subunit